MATQPEVTAAELVRHFARYREEASRQPVFVTHHGKRKHVLLSIAEFDATQGADSSTASEQTLAEDMIHNLADWIDEALVLVRADETIEFANRVAQAITRQPARSLMGRNLFEGLPELAGSLMEVHARRTMTGSEPSAADIPSPFTEGSWLRFQSFPLGDRIVLKFRDITEDVRNHRLADVKETIIAAMSIHGEIGYIRLTVRGTIARVDHPFCTMLELPEQRLQGIPIADLVEVSSRASFRDSLEQVLGQSMPMKVETRFLANSGQVITATMAMAPLQGAYGAEGAIVILTSASKSG